MTRASATGSSSLRVVAIVVATVALLSVSGEAKPTAAHDDDSSRGRLLFESCETFCIDKAGVYANPCDPTCSTFFNCDHRVTAPTSCGSGLKFNPTYKVCDWAQNVVCGVPIISSSPPPPLAPTANPRSPTMSRLPPPPPSVPGGAVLFAPFKDVTINMDWNSYVISSSITGTRLPVTDSRVMPPNLRVLIWSFATGNCGSETWAGVAPSSLVSANVKAFVDAGKQYIISTGGAAGVFRCDTDSGFKSFIQRYYSSALIGIDFDIEGGQSQADIENLVARVKAARAGSYSNLRYSFTLQTLGGSSGNQLNLLGTRTMNALKNARMGWSNIFVNLMTMDYSNQCTVFNGGVCDMGQSAINAAKALNSYWGVPYSNIELTPMIGANDSPGQTFTLADVKTVSSFVTQNGLGGVRFWSLDRDVNCPPGPASATCNSYGQAGTLGFTKAFLSALGSPTVGGSTWQPLLSDGGVIIPEDIQPMYDTAISTLEPLINPGVVSTNVELNQVINVNCGDPMSRGLSNGPSPSRSPAMTVGGSGSCQYTIMAGDTLWAISQNYGTTVGTLESLNPGIVATNLQVGQVINVPCNNNVGPGPRPSPDALYSGSGSGTYYFDIKGNYCPQDPNGYQENYGYPACASWTPGTATYKKLIELGSNNVVAIDNGVLSANRARLCGKKVLVYKNGVPVAAPDGGNFFVWDGCAACAGGVRIDFSVSGLQQADPNACNVGVVPGITWQVVDEVVQQFIP